MCIRDRLEEAVAAGQDTKAAQLYYNKIVPCGGYLRQYTQDVYKRQVLFRLAAAHSAQRRTGGQRQHTAAGNRPPAHSPASGSAFAFWPA